MIARVAKTNINLGEFPPQRRFTISRTIVPKMRFTAIAMRMKYNIGLSLGMLVSEIPPIKEIEKITTSSSIPIELDFPNLNTPLNT